MNEALDMMIEIRLKSEDDFLKIKETLTRIGVSSSTENRLYPSVLILHKKGKYYLTHFKTMFLLDGKSASINQTDIARFRTIAALVTTWGLCDMAQKSDEELCRKSFNPKLVKVVPFAEKKNWQIIPKYQLGLKQD